MERIYLLEDDDSIRKLVIYALGSQGYEAQGFDRPFKLSDLLQKAGEIIQCRIQWRCLLINVGL